MEDLISVLWSKHEIFQLHLGPSLLVVFNIHSRKVASLEGYFKNVLYISTLKDT